MLKSSDIKATKVFGKKEWLLLGGIAATLLALGFCVTAILL
jgi:hypothetical protein